MVLVLIANRLADAVGVEDKGAIVPNFIGKMRGRLCACLQYMRTQSDRAGHRGVLRAVLADHDGCRCVLRLLGTRGGDVSADGVAVGLVGRALSTVDGHQMQPT